jgi:hypothetical protein
MILTLMSVYERGLAERSRHFYMLNSLKITPCQST